MTPPKPDVQKDKAAKAKAEADKEAAEQEEHDRELERILGEELGWEGEEEEVAVEDAPPEIQEALRKFLEQENEKNEKNKKNKKTK